MTNDDIEKEKPVWKLEQHLIFDKAYVALYRHIKLKAQLEIITKRKRLQPIGKGESYYFLEGHEQEFRTYKDMMNYYDTLDDLNQQKLKR